eukprot:TRINITY_DN11442_c0_g1_i1.p2 TRINITY_DN11442_c0_g1~~TRINITY_DN11442_c0_g1_i1.p2  ORF type:complete len:370 (+),score=86.06 TRINITY_DN11442_c0_g1_i1:67-1110(+)
MAAALARTLRQLAGANHFAGGEAVRRAGCLDGAAVAAASGPAGGLSRRRAAAEQPSARHHAHAVNFRGFSGGSSASSCLPPPVTRAAVQSRAFSSARPPRNPYSVLGVEPSASRQDVTSAYHALALKWHPDRNPGDPAAEERFKEVAAAYRALKDSEGQAAAGFADAAGMTREEAEQIFREVFGADTLSEATAVAERAEAFKGRLEQEVLERHPGAEAAALQLIVGGHGNILMRAAVSRGGRTEIYERALREEEAAEITDMGTGMVRLAGLAVRDVATKVVTEVGQGVANGVFNFIAEGVNKAGQTAASLLPFPLPLPPPFPGLQPPPAASREGKADGHVGKSTAAK